MRPDFWSSNHFGHGRSEEWRDVEHSAFDMQADCLKRDFRKVMALSLVIAGVIAIAIAGFAVAAGQPILSMAANENRSPMLKTDCKAKADKLMRLMEATAPVVR
jgi:hypothetical protein